MLLNLNFIYQGGLFLPDYFLSLLIHVVLVVMQIAHHRHVLLHRVKRLVILRVLIKIMVQRLIVLVGV